jgi:hypothetical protein
MSIIDRVVLGAVAGFSATMIMTMFMERSHEQLPAEEEYPLPPRELTDRILPDLPRMDLWAMLAHFGYGAASGGLFGALNGRIPALLFGPLVWAASYLGWIPAARRLDSADDHPVERNVLMIGAHLVWGAALGLFLNELQRASGNSFASGRLRDAPDEEGDEE